MNENNSPSDEANQEPVTEKLDEAHPTEPPPPITNHGWLDQFQAFSSEAFEEMKKVASEGLQEFEARVLAELAVKLVTLAEEHYPGLAKEVSEELSKL